MRVIDAFVEQLDLRDLGFKRAHPSVTGRPGYQPATLLKIYVYGYLNRIQSSRRLERESHRNVERYLAKLDEADKEETGGTGSYGRGASREDRVDEGEDG